MPIAVIYITSGLLFLGAAPMPYGYYQLLRIVGTAVFVWASVVAYQRKHQALPWVYACLAIVFNPILKITFPKELWMAIDAGSAVLLLVSHPKIVERSDP